MTQLGLPFHDFALVAATSKKSSGSFLPFLVFIGIALLVWLFYLRPQSQKRKRAAQDNQQAGPGDEVMLAGGIIGRVVEIQGDRASIEIAPDIEIEVVRRAIAQRLAPADEPDVNVSPDPGAEDDSDYPHTSDEYDSDDEYEHENGVGDYDTGAEQHDDDEEGAYGELGQEESNP